MEDTWECSSSSKIYLVQNHSPAGVHAASWTKELQYSVVSTSSSLSWWCSHDLVLIQCQHRHHHYIRVMMSAVASRVLYLHSTITGLGLLVVKLRGSGLSSPFNDTSTGTTDDCTCLETVGLYVLYCYTHQSLILMHAHRHTNYTQTHKLHTDIPYLEMILTRSWFAQFYHHYSSSFS